MVSALIFGLSGSRSSADQGHCVLFLDKMYGLLTKCAVKMTGFWPSSFFACLWTETQLSHVDPAMLTEQAWSIKDLLYGFWENFSCGTQQVVPSG